MSLDFDVSKIKDYKDVTTAPYDVGGRKQWHPVTNSLVWWTIPIGINQITETNIDKVWERIQVWQALTGSVMGNSEREIWLTREDVFMHIGLSTNASNKTDTEFYKTLVRQVRDGFGNPNRDNPEKLSALRTIGWQNHASEVSKKVEADDVAG